METKEKKVRRGKKRNVYPVFKIIDDKLVYQGSCANVNHVSKVIKTYSANVGMYLDFQLNKLGDYVVVEIEIEDSEFIDGKSVMVRAHQAAEKRHKRSRLNFTVDKMKKISDEQVEQINKILNEGNNETN